jgi:hypothetical protein
MWVPIEALIGTASLTARYPLGVDRKTRSGGFAVL